MMPGPVVIASDGGERSDCRQLAASIRAGSSDSVSHQLVKTTFSVFIRRLFVTEKSHATALSKVDTRFENFLITVSTRGPKHVEANQFVLPVACLHADLHHDVLELAPLLGYCSAPLPGKIKMKDN